MSITDVVYRMEDRIGELREENRRLREVADAAANPEIDYMLRWFTEGSIATGRVRAYKRLRKALDAMREAPTGGVREG